MGIFTRSESLTEIRNEVERLQTKVKALQTEWDDFYDKAAKILRRIGRDRAKLEESESTQEPNGEAPAESPAQAPFGFLSPRQREAQQKILRRRAGLQ